MFVCIYNVFVFHYVYMARFIQEYAYIDLIQKLWKSIFSSGSKGLATRLLYAMAIENI